MELLEFRHFRGPNLDAPRSAARVRFRLTRLADWDTSRLDGDRAAGLAALLAGLDVGTAAGREIVGALRGEGHLGFPGVLERVVVAILAASGEDPGPAGTREERDGSYRMFYACADRGLAALAWNLTLHLVYSQMAPAERPGVALPPDFDFHRSLASLCQYASNRRLDLTTAALVAAAEARDIPWQRLGPLSRFVQLGHGRHGTRIHESVTGNTSALAYKLSHNKEATARLLWGLGIPVPRQVVAGNEREAVRAAEHLGYPVVVKPSHGEKGDGVTVGASDAAAVEVAFRGAAGHPGMVLVEALVPGHDHRLLVVGGRLVAAARKVPARVVGDGIRSVEGLVDEVNRDPRRKTGFAGHLVRLELDGEAADRLARAGLSRTSVLEAGRSVELRGTANVSTGGTAVDVTDAVHPETRDIVLRAVAALGLDVAGVDYLSPDVSRSYREVGGAICEINASPGLRPHWVAEGGEGRDVAGAIVDALFPAGSRARVPSAAITGTNGKTTTARMVAAILARRGDRVGLTTTDGVYVDGRMVRSGDHAGGGPALDLLTDPRVDAAVFELGRRGLVRDGMGIDGSDVAAVLNVAGDHVGTDGIDTVESLAEVKSLIVRHARHAVVLNADDPLCLAMVADAGTRDVCLVSPGGGTDRVAAHVAAGNPAATIEDDGGRPHLVLHAAGRGRSVVAVDEIPATVGGLAAHNAENALFAAAVAASLGATPEQIRDGLASFSNDYDTAPGRLNFFRGLPFEVILDYGHNPHGVAAVCAFLGRYPVSGSRRCVLTAPGNRLDGHFAEIGRVAAGRFDHYVCCSWANPRGRAPDEVPRLLEKGLRDGGVAPERIERIPDRVSAVDHALGLARPGDLVLVLSDDVHHTWRQIASFEGHGKG